MRIIMQFEKTSDAKFTSHLDMQRAMGRVLRRAQVKLKYSSGFNPHPIMSFASALSLGFTSCAEFVDITVFDITEDEFMQAVAPAMPNSLKLVGAHIVPDKYPALTSLLDEAVYEITLTNDANLTNQELSQMLQTLLATPILAVKKGKGGEKEIDIRELIKHCEVLIKQDKIVVRLSAVCSATGALNPNLLVAHLLQAFNANQLLGICRLELLAKESKPIWAAI